MSNFQPQQLGLTAWIEGNRIDFSLHGPLMAEAVRCTAMRGKDNSELTLEGKALKVRYRMGQSRNQTWSQDRCIRFSELLQIFKPQQQHSSDN